MKKIIIAFVVTLLCVNDAAAEKFKILTLNTPEIKINGQPYRVGGVFDYPGNVDWANKSQSMVVKNLSTGRLFRFSEKTLEYKSVSSIQDYFKVTKMTSTRGDSNLPLFTKSPISKQFPEKRIALVIGNSNYDELSHLRNAQKDATDVANMLLDLGFDVVEAYECSYSDMRTVLNNFKSKVKKDNYNVALFYYAGHGTEDENHNYLIPVDNPLQLPDDIRFCINANDVMLALESSDAEAKLMFIDACRVNKSWERGADTGFARMEGPIGSVIMFSTKAGKAASDGDGENSPFAKAVIKNISIPELGFATTLQRIVKDTHIFSNEKQDPVPVGMLLNEFYFNPRRINAPSSGSTFGSSEWEYYVKGVQYYNEKKYMEAIEKFRKAADQGIVLAQEYLGKMYRYGLGTPTNYSEAIKWYKKAADQGSAASQNSLGYMYQNELEDYVEAMKWYRKSADQGYASAQYNLGYMYLNELGTPTNYSEAMKWFRKAADQGLAIAQNYLGYMYGKGLGVSQDYFEAKKWHLKAAEQGLADAQNSLGYMYENGLGGNKNYPVAIEWYKKAADQGDAAAQNNLGYMYYNGLGVPQDYLEAIKWYRKAADQGNAYAQYNLGYMYGEGIGVPKDYAEAMKWYRKSADQGFATAQNSMGYMYENGLGVKKNYPVAIEWYKKASSFGLEDAKAALKRLGITE